MTPQWTDAILRLTLRGGSVYYLQHRCLSSAEPHFFVVLNLDPLGDNFLILAVASSNVENVRHRYKDLPPETLVEISPADYPDFRLPSIVDCNHWFPVTKQELLHKLKTGLASEKAPISSALLARLRQGMLASPLIEDELRDRLR
jgi:hypothetical protein